MKNKFLLKRLEGIAKRYEELQKEISKPEIVQDIKKYQKLNKELKELSEIYETYKLYQRYEREYEESKELLRSDDEDIKALAEEETKRLQEKLEETEDKLKELMIPKDPNESKNIILEIRAGAGGEEAALFAADLFRMYQKYAEEKGWKITILNTNRTGLGGFKEVIALVEGKDVYSRLKYESGVHRVQRIPVTESGGRIHTSTVTVAVLPEAGEEDININPQDLRIETFRASGAGGQYVNTTETAVRITHIPTGITVSCQEERSQYQNRQKAMKILYARLKDYYNRLKEEEIARERREQVGTGERSEKIRTYNFPQNRVTDHRINLTLYKLPEILEGNLDELIDALRTAEIEEKIKEMEKAL